MLAHFSPTARTSHLVTTELDGEMIVYDRAAHHLHHLNAPTVAVWRRCDGQSSLATIAHVSGLDEATVRLALTNLAAAGLLETELPAEVRSPVQSRRRLLKRALAIGTVPAIVSVTAPVAAQMESPGSVPICGTANTCTHVPGEWTTCTCRCRYPLNSPPQLGQCYPDGSCQYSCPV